MDNVSTSPSCTGSQGAEDGTMVVLHGNSKKDNQMVAVSDSNNGLPGDVYGCNQEFDIDQIFDLVTSTDDLSTNSEMIDDVSMMMNTDKNQNWCSNSEAVERGAVALHRDLEQDNVSTSRSCTGSEGAEDVAMVVVDSNSKKDNPMVLIVLHDSVNLSVLKDDVVNDLALIKVNTAHLDKRSST
ncbi:hypothetical protein Bca52824_069647 [Brassica carinata]|uniref:Uncharacterized protein n=1 Tax=Brassica carinata TaxID=52824 RepID=A0A8X7Q402_BRACI|nr:hypothetical protein Bca52824_069647 [Brassica carinata]